MWDHLLLAQKLKGRLLGLSELEGNSDSEYLRSHWAGGFGGPRQNRTD